MLFGRHTRFTFSSKNQLSWGEKTKMANENTQTLDQPVKNVVQLASEFVVPGGSNLINGDIKQGGMHVLLGLAAGAVLGPVGIFAVAANSFSKATTGRHLYEHLNLARTNAPE